MRFVRKLGRGGVVKKFLDHITPSARANVASRFFLIAHPPLFLLGLLLNPGLMSEQPFRAAGLHAGGVKESWRNARRRRARSGSAAAPARRGVPLSVPVQLM